MTLQSMFRKVGGRKGRFCEAGTASPPRHGRTPQHVDMAYPPGIHALRQSRRSHNTCSSSPCSRSMPLDWFGLHLPAYELALRSRASGRLAGVCFETFTTETHAATRRARHLRRRRRRQPQPFLLAAKSNVGTAVGDPNNLLYRLLHHAVPRVHDPSHRLAHGLHHPPLAYRHLSPDLT